MTGGIMRCHSLSYMGPCELSFSHLSISCRCTHLSVSNTPQQNVRFTRMALPLLSLIVVQLPLGPAYRP